MNSPKYVGIDQSFKHTAIVVMASPHDYKVYSIKGKGRNSLEKLKGIRGEIQHIFFSMETLDIRWCFIEGGAFKSSGPIFSLGQLSGLILGLLMEHKIPIKEIPPSRLKKFITEHGNATKEVMMREIGNRFGEHFNDDNVADAYGLALMGYFYENWKTLGNKNRGSKEVVAVEAKKIPRSRYRRKKLEF
jgi:Holliday junction resolvasome RuvABC endonuclease subunit